MDSRVSRFIATMCFAIASASAQTIQELGLTNPVQYEAVFSQVVMGPFGDLDVETEFVAVNPGNEPALLEMDFRTSDGESLHPHNHWKAPNDVEADFQPFASSGGITRYYAELAPHSVRRYTLPGEDEELALEPLQGWARFRSNQSVLVLEKIRVTDRESGEYSEASVAGSYSGALEATSNVKSFKCETYSGDPIFDDGVHNGWRVTTHGVSVANPGDEVNTLELELEGRRAEITLGPQSQRSFLIWELFPHFTPRTCGKSEAVCILSKLSLPFAVSILRQRTWTDLDGNLKPVGGPIPLDFKGPGEKHTYFYLKMPQARRFDFPVHVVDELQSSNLKIVLSRFGFNLIAAGGDSEAVFQLNRGKDINYNPNTGIAVITGGRQFPIIFLGSHKVVTIDKDLDSARIEDLPDENQVRISHSTCYYQIVITLDKTLEEVVSIEETWEYDCPF